MAHKERKRSLEPLPAADPRLQYLLSLPAAELRALHAREAHQLQAIEERILGRRALLEGARDATRAERQQELAAAWSELFAPLSAGVHYFRRGGEAWFSLFLLSEAGERDLHGLGAELRSRSGDVHTALVRRSKLRGLLRSGAVRYAELARALFPDLGFSLPFAGFDALHASGVGGAGVALCVVDDGIDWGQAAFRDLAGKTRIAWLWDQTLTPGAGEQSPPADQLPGFLLSGGASYGVEYSAADIDDALAGTKSLHHDHGSGHGTRVAACAAGADGAAPQATLLCARPVGVVESALLLDSVHVADAFSWAFARAQQAGLPCVVNMSMSSDLGAHDGSSLLESYLDDLLGVPGRALTLSAGNSGGYNSHARGKVGTAAPAELVLTYAVPPLTGHQSDAAEIWYGGHERFRAQLSARNAAGQDLGTVGLSPSDPPVELALADGVVLILASELDHPRNQANRIRLDISVPPGGLVPARLELELEALAPILDGRFDAWVERSNRASSDWLGAVAAQDELTVANPATARRALTAGAHGKPPGAGTLAVFPGSGQGPTRDGRTKPDLAAYGHSVAGLPGGALAGTSAAAAFLAGACALLFECRGSSSTWADLRQILSDTAGAVPGAPAPHKAFGMGYLQVKAACALPAPKVDVWIRDDPTDTGVEPSTAAIYWACPDIELVSPAGLPIAKPVHDPTLAFTTRVRVSVRNRGSSAALGTEVFLYWADPATGIPFPGEWRSDGILVLRDGAPAQGNRLAVQRLEPNAAAQVEFLWQPPPPTSNQRADGHFCLLARLENGADPSLLGAGGWLSVTARNNIGLRNVHVVSATPEGAWSYSFSVFGTGGEVGGGPEPAADSLLVWAEEDATELELTLPVLALPWRELAVLRAYGGSLPRSGRLSVAGGPLDGRELRLSRAELEQRTEVRGARELRLRDGLATLLAGEGGRLFLPRLRLDPGLPLPAWLHGRARSVRPKGVRVHVAQRSAGRPAGGCSLLISG